VRPTGNATIERTHPHKRIESEHFKFLCTKFWYGAIHKGRPH